MNTWLEDAVRAAVSLVVVGLVVCSVSPLAALDRTWFGGDGTWTEGVTTGWSSADEPDADDVAFFNTNNTVEMGSSNTITGLELSGGIDLSTSDNDLMVNGLIEVLGAGTNLFIGGAASSVLAEDLTISGGTVELRGGDLSVAQPGFTNGVILINAGGTLSGNGAILLDSPLVSATVLNNNGALTALSRAANVLFPPPTGTLSIGGGIIAARIDLDGTGEAGVVNVNRNQTLDINIAPSDAFSGDMNLFHNATFDMDFDWTLAAGGVINADNGATIGIPGVPAGTSTIAGGTLTQTGGTINVVDTDGTLQFDAVFETNAGSVVNNGHVIFNNNALLGNGANLTMPTTSSRLTVAAGRTVEIVHANFNMDGANSVNNRLTVEAGGELVIGTTDYDPDQATNAYDGTITLNSGDIDMTTSDAEFVMDGTLNMNSTGGNSAGWFGEPLDVGNDAGALDANVNVTGASLAPAQFGASVDFNSDADVNVASGGLMQFLSNSTVNFDTVNGANNAEFTGAGRLEFNGTVNVNEAVTLNMVGGSIDLDGTDSQGNFINVDAPLVINTEAMLSFGKVNGAGGINTLDINNSVGTGVLTVNLDDANDEWTLNTQGVMNLVNDNAEATLLAGNDVNINGEVNVTGDVRTTARLDIGSTAIVNINTANEPLRLAGGDNSLDPASTDRNTISGGTIAGVGVLGADTGKALHGFGTITTSIDFDGASNLFADNGTLTINGSILDVARIGTFDADGTLNVVNAWDTGVASFVTLEGGTLQGGTMTINNINGVSGQGLITARLINNVRLRASGGTLVVQTAGNDNDWDGAAGGGTLTAVNSGTLELRDVGAAFAFLGTAEASSGGRIFANGFALDFNPGSTLTLAGNGKYESTASTDIGGTVTVGVGGAMIEVANNNFLTFETGSATTLGSNLMLKNNNINIEAGATFSGGGALVVPDGSHLVADNLANIGVLLDMQGAFRPGNSEGIGRVDLFDFQQANTGELFVELRGTALNAFDRLVASGDVVLDGYLNIDIDEISPGVPFVPTLGQTFNIITANTVTGTFDFADVSGMPAGLAFHIEYLSNAVQLQVVTKPIFDADFDNDGDVDPTDLAIWQGAYNLNQLGDADGDNDSDGRDFLIWQRQFGSAPLSAISASTAVPEPSAGLLILLGVVSLFPPERRTFARLV